MTRSLAQPCGLSPGNGGTIAPETGSKGRKIKQGVETDSHCPKPNGCFHAACRVSPVTTALDSAKSPLGSRNAAFAPVTFKVPSRSGLPLWKTFLALNSQCRYWEVLLRSDIPFGGGCRHEVVLTVNLGACCCRLTHRERKVGAGEEL